MAASLKFFGGAFLEGSEGPLSGAVAQRRRLALLAQLALSPTGRVSRDKLLAYLWPEHDTERARHALSNSLYIIKKALGEDAVVAVGEDLELGPALDSVDVLEFEMAVRDGELERAATLYTGPFMDGVHLKDAPELEKWIDGERERLARAYAQVLESLAEKAAAERRVTEATDWWRRLAAHDPYDTRIALALMKALAAAGNRAEAIQHAQVHAELLKDAFGAEPDPAIGELVESLRREGPSLREAPTVTEPEVAAQPGTPASPAAVAPTRLQRVLGRRSLHWALVALAGVVLFGIADTLLTLRQPDEPELSTSDVGARPDLLALTAGRDRPAVAVLPFDNMSADPAEAYFADGMHDEIITQLAKISDLTVISRTSVMQFRETDRSIPEIAAELGVTAVLEGAARRAGDTVRITAQLIDAATDAHLWAETFDREFAPANVLGIQSEIARNVADALAATLTSEEMSRIAAVPTGSLSAYDLYLKGWQAYRRYRSEENEEAIRSFKDAIALDPDYALAWAGLANAYAQRPYVYGFPRIWYDSAEAAGLRSVELDPELGQGWKALGLVYTVRGWVSRSIEAYQKALNYSPNHDGALNNLGMAYFYLGAYDEALRWLKRAARVAPTRGRLLANVGSRYLDLGELAIGERWIRAALELYPEFPEGLADQKFSLYLARRDLEGALRGAEADVEANPSDPAAHMWAARAAAFARRYDQALEHVEAAERLAGPASIDPYVAGFVHLATGNRVEAESYFERAEARERIELEDKSERPEVRLSLAMIYAARGDKVEALAWLQRAFDAGERRSVWIDSNPMFDSIRGSPEFRELITRIKAEVEEMRRRLEREEIAAGER